MKKSPSIVVRAALQQIHYGIAPSPFGQSLIAWISGGAICGLFFIEGKNDQEVRRILKDSWPTAQLFEDKKTAAQYAKRIFNRSATVPTSLVFSGTDFQIKAWEALLKIPFGRTAGYGDIASAIGSPKAARAVGSACGKNRIAFLVPCHRVIASSGAIGRYRWGAKRKRDILAWEAALQGEVK